MFSTNVWLVFILDCQVDKVLVTAVEDIDVNVSFNAVNLADVGVLPKSPIAFVLQGIDVVVGYPVVVSVEIGSVEICRFEFVAGVEDGKSAIVLLYGLHPL